MIPLLQAFYSWVKVKPVGEFNKSVGTRVSVSPVGIVRSASSTVCPLIVASVPVDNPNDDDIPNGGIS